MSFEDVRNTLLIAYADGFLDDEEFSILYDYYQPVNPPIFQTGILIYSVWMSSALASAKLTSEWPRMIFRFY